MGFDDGFIYREEGNGRWTIYELFQKRPSPLISGLEEWQAKSICAILNK